VSGVRLLGTGAVGQLTAVQHAFTETLPDLIDASEYSRYPDGALVRIRISVTDAGVEILGDGLRPELIEQVLATLGGGPLEQMLCG
jgi:FtsH ternary system-associated peptide